MLSIGENDLERLDHEELMQDTTKYIFEWDSHFRYEYIDRSMYRSLSVAHNSGDLPTFMKLANKALKDHDIPAKIISVLVAGGWPITRLRTTKPITYREVEKCIWDRFNQDFGFNDTNNTIIVKKIVE